MLKPFALKHDNDICVSNQASPFTRQFCFSASTAHQEGLAALALEAVAQWSLPQGLGKGGLESGGSVYSD